MNTLVISGALAQESKFMLLWNDPDVVHLCSLKQLVDAILLSKEPLLERTEFNKDDDIFGLGKIFFYDSLYPRSFVSGQVFDRRTVDNAAWQTWKNELDGFEFPNEQGIQMWIKHYFMDSYLQGCDIQPCAYFYPGHLAAHLAMTSPGWMPKEFTTLVQQRSGLNADQIARLTGQRRYAVPIPFLLEAVLKRASSPKTIVEAAHALRDSSQMKALREWLYREEDLPEEPFFAELMARARQLSAALIETSHSWLCVCETVRVTCPPGNDRTPYEDAADLYLDGAPLLPREGAERHYGLFNIGFDIRSSDLAADVEALWGWRPGEKDIYMFNRYCNLGIREFGSTASAVS